MNEIKILNKMKDEIKWLKYSFSIGFAILFTFIGLVAIMVAPYNPIVDAILYSLIIAIILLTIIEVIVIKDDIDNVKIKIKTTKLYK
ncbi:MAG: hypothetical protein QXO65_03320 [Candidatus Aenigmatarchaeota archaeon]